MDRNDGGSAFPFVVRNDEDAFEPGMTLRDYFAAKAMSVVMQTMFESMLKEPNLAKKAATDCATFSYSMADAMLKARNA